MKLRNHHASEVVKLLLLGDPGSGKTGALAALANAGYELFIQDYDNGADILHQYVRSDCLDSVNIEVLTDKMKMTADGMAVPIGQPTAYMRGVKLLTKWIDRETKEDFGGISSWGPERVLVIDSITLLGIAMMHYVKFQNSAIMERDWGYYGPAMELQEKLLNMLHSDNIGCNVIITSHIVKIADQKKIEVVNREGKTTVQSIDVGEAKGYPSALGNKLPPKVGRFFNAALRCKSVGGAHKLVTVSDDEIELKTPAPKNVPRDFKLGTGLAEYFEIVKKTAQHPELVEGDSDG